MGFEERWRAILTALLVIAGLPASGTAQTERVSLAPPGVDPTGASTGAVMSADGRSVVFQSSAANLVSGDTNGRIDVFVRDRHAGQITRVSVATGGVQATGGDSVAAAISANGRFVAFHSFATNLVPGDTNGLADIFVHDRWTGATTRANLASGGAQAVGGHSFNPSIDGAGDLVSFESYATNLVSGDTNGRGDVFVRRLRAATTTRISVGPGGVQATGGDSFGSTVSLDGRVVAFIANATNLVPGDTNATNDIFVHDLGTGQTTRESVDSDEVQNPELSWHPRLSADGRFVVFETEGALGHGDANGASDIYLRDRLAGTTVFASWTDGTFWPNGHSGRAAISADGRFVTFESGATNVVAGDTNGRVDVFMRDRILRTTVRLSVDSGGVEADGASARPAMSGDGRYVSFDSAATNLVGGDGNAASDVFVRDVDKYQRRRLSVSSGGVEADGSSGLQAISNDGRFVAFVSAATNLVPNDTNGRDDVFVHDRHTGEVARVSVGPGGVQASGGFGRLDPPAISGDGRYVAFRSDAINLVAHDTNGLDDVFVHDRGTGGTTRVSVSSEGTQANGASSLGLSISADGRWVAFASPATNLVSDDSNGLDDVFVHDRLTGRTTRASVGPGNAQANGISFQPHLSADGSTVAFVSGASNLVAGDTNARADIFVRNLGTGTVTRASVGVGTSESNESSWMSTGSAVDQSGRRTVFTSGATNLVSGDGNSVGDVFLRDTSSATTRRVSTSEDGVEGNASSAWASISANGQVVVFNSFAANLVSGDRNGVEDLFAYDARTRTLTRVNLTTSGRESIYRWDRAGYATSSADGRAIVYASFADDLVPNDTNGTLDVFVRAENPVLTGVYPSAGPNAGGTIVRLRGNGFTEGTTVRLGGADATHVQIIATDLLQFTTPAAGATGPVDIVVTVPAHDPQRLVYGFRYTASVASTSTDTDGDGLPDTYEWIYSLDPTDPRDGGSADVDGDGVSNADERTAGTHPTGVVTRYLAEGATGPFFRTRLAIANPDAGDATVLLHFLRRDGVVVDHPLRVMGRSRATVDVGTIAGMEAAEFATTLEADRPVVLDRLMEWDESGYGSHAETASATLSTTWYFAEGATHSGFALFYLLQNPHATSTTVDVTFLRPVPQPPVTRRYTLAPKSRFTIWVNTVASELAATDVSATITASQPIMAERAMYLSRDGRTFTAGHESAAAPARALSWFFAEGATGPYFDLFLLLANPDTTVANVKATFLRPDGTTVVRFYSVAPQSRFNIWVDLEDPLLSDTAVSTTIEVTNGVPIIGERAMWWPQNSGWFEAHNSPGATAAGTAWAMAAGEDGSSRSAETYVLIANTAAYPATARVTVLFEDGSTAVREFALNPTSRFNVPVGPFFPAAVGRRFGLLVESVGLGAAPLVVEQAIYANEGGARWQAGSNALGTRLRP